jgi:small conductance mechanosensitive channel
MITKYRRGSILAVAIVSFMLLIFASESYGQETPVVPKPDNVTDASPVEEATTVIQNLFESFTAFIPRIFTAAVIFLLAFIVSLLVKLVFKKLLAGWNRSVAVSALASVSIYMVAAGSVMSVLAGDVRALLGSVGLVGLALSWSLQAPIESFTGWILNSLRGYYGIGDRIEVGDVFGDVFRIDVLTTTVWQAGGPGKPVQAAQPTGALITFPNSEVLRANIINYTRDFPYVWDELSLDIANESDLRHTLQVVKDTASRVLGSAMCEPSQQYRDMLQGRGLSDEVREEPSVFAQPFESWTRVVVRYLVHARERRLRISELYIAISEELSKPEHASKIVSGYPRQQVEITQLGGA